jgi:hypothetical protein
MKAPMITVEMDIEQAGYVKAMIEKETARLRVMIADKCPLTMFTKPLESSENVISQIDEQLYVEDPQNFPSR